MNVMTFDDFQRLPRDQQSEEIFKLLSMLTPFASEVSSLRSSVESCIHRLGELEQRQQQNFRVPTGKIGRGNVQYKYVLDKFLVIV